MVLLSLETKEEMQCISRFYNTTDLASSFKVGEQGAGELLSRLKKKHDFSIQSVKYRFFLDKWKEEIL